MPSPPYLPLGHVACLPQPSCLRATCQVSQLQGQEGAAQAEYDKTFVLNFGKKVCHMAVDPVLSLFTSPCSPSSPARDVISSRTHVPLVPRVPGRAQGRDQAPRARDQDSQQGSRCRLQGFMRAHTLPATLPLVTTHNMRPPPSPRGCPPQRVPPAVATWQVDEKASKALEKQQEAYAKVQDGADKIIADATKAGVCQPLSTPRPHGRPIHATRLACSRRVGGSKPRCADGLAGLGVLQDHSI